MWTLVLAPRSAPSTRSATEPATRSMPSSRAAPRAQLSAGPSSGSAPAAVCSGVPSTGHFSGRTTSSAPRRGRRAREPVGRLEVAVAIGVGTELHGCGAHGGPLLGRRLTRQSIPSAARIPAMRTHKAWTWVGAFGPELMLCAASARIGPARTSWWAVWDGERLHERTHRRLGPVDGDAGARPRRRRARPRGRAGRAVGRADGRDLDAQAPGAGSWRGPGPRGRAARARRRVGGPPPAHDVVVVERRRGRARRRPAGDVEPRRRAARRRQGLGAGGLDRRRAVARPAAAVRRPATESATFASALSPRVPGARTCCSCRRTTSSRSGRSRARCRSVARCRVVGASWSATRCAGERELRALREWVRAPVNAAGGRFQPACIVDGDSRRQRCTAGAACSVRRVPTPCRVT